MSAVRQTQIVRYIKYLLKGIKIIMEKEFLIFKTTLAQFMKKRPCVYDNGKIVYDKVILEC